MKKLIALLVALMMVTASAAALAEDIVRGETKIDTCLFMNRRSQTSEDAIRSIWGDRISTKKIEPEKQ